MAAEDHKGYTVFDVAGLSGKYRAPLTRYFVRRGFPVDQSEDCVQDVFLRMARTDLASVVDTEAYLFTVASSVAIDHRRRSASRHAADHDQIDKIEIESKEASPCRVLEDREAIVRLDRVLDELSGRTREIFLLNRLDGLSYTQLAVRFGLSVAAIEKHMSKALAHLRKRLPRNE
jgi:RNA polymerase sigma-70 factor (ECF subfamily)